MLKAITYISVTDLPLHSIPFHSSSSPQGSPPLDFQPDNWDGLFMLLNITLSAATEIENQHCTECSEPWPMPLRSQREEHDRTCRPSPSGWSVLATADTATERRTASLTSCGCGGRGRRRRAIACQGEHGASQLRACRRPPRPSPDLLLLSLMDRWWGGMLSKIRKRRRKRWRAEIGGRKAGAAIEAARVAGSRYFEGSTSTRQSTLASRKKCHIFYYGLDWQHPL